VSYYDWAIGMPERYLCAFKHLGKYKDSLSRELEKMLTGFCNKNLE